MFRTDKSFPQIVAVERGGAASVVHNLWITLCYPLGLAISIVVESGRVLTCR